MDMALSAADIIARLGLKPHPEGGHCQFILEWNSDYVIARRIAPKQSRNLEEETGLLRFTRKIGKANFVASSQ